MKLRMTLHQATYTYTSHNCSFTPDETWDRFYIDFESDNVSLIFDKIAFHAGECIEIAQQHIKSAVKLNVDLFGNTPEWTFTYLLNDLPYTSADEHYMYWWSIVKLED